MPVAATADAAMRSAMRVGNLADLDFSATFEGQKKGSPSPYEVPATALEPAGLVRVPVTARLPDVAYDGPLRCPWRRSSASRRWR